MNRLRQEIGGVIKILPYGFLLIFERWLRKRKISRLNYFIQEVLEFKVFKLNSPSTWCLNSHTRIGRFHMQKKHWPLWRFWQNSKGAGSR